MVNTFLAEAKLTNEMYARGFRFYCEGDYEVLDSTDPWSGMPNTTHNLYFFDNKEEAEAFASTQTWVFNSDIHATVKEVPKHRETWEEYVARVEKEKADRKAKQTANEEKKAKEAGLTIEEYKAEKKHQSKVKRLEKEIESLKEELARKEKELARVKAK